MLQQRPSKSNGKGASLVWIHGKVCQHIATVFGLGHWTKAPGTLGSVAAIPLWYVLHTQLSPNAYLLAVAGCAFLGIWVSTAYVNQKQSEDPSEIVVDEVVGFLITMAWLPAHWFYVVAGFILFRVLDIFKPYPISMADQKIKGGVGVMADDMLAGIIANLILQIICQSRILPW